MNHITVGNAGSGFLSLDIKPPAWKAEIEEAIGKTVFPGYTIRIIDAFKWYNTGFSMLIVDDEEEWESYGTKFKQFPGIGVMSVGQNTCLVTVKTSIFEKVIRKVFDKVVLDKFCYNKDVKLSKKLLDGTENELFELSIVSSKSKPVDVDMLENLEKYLIVEEFTNFKFIPFGKQIAWRVRKVNEAIKGIGGNTRPIGPVVMTGGYRLWSLFSMPNKYCASMHRRSPSYEDDLREEVEEFLDKIDDYKVFKKVWWGEEWIG